MIVLKLFQKFPKAVIAAAILISSCGLFFLWWINHDKEEPVAVAEVPPQPPFEATDAPQLFLAGNDLYNIDTGQLLAANWIGGELPLKLWHDTRTGKFIGRFPLVLVRYDVYGKPEAQLLGHQGNGVTFSEDGNTAIYAKERDIWIAGIDWENFKLIHEKRVTTQGNIIDRSFLDSILLATDKVLVVRNLNQMLRVNLETAEVTLTRIPISEVGERRSPDGSMLLGEMRNEQQNKLFVYDVETDEAKFFDLDRGRRPTEFVWLDNDKAAYLVNGRELWLYDRKANEVNKVMDLPNRFTQMALPSPTGRYLFCYNMREAVIADLEGKTSVPTSLEVQGYEWIADDTIIGSLDAADTNHRGIWIAKLVGGKSEPRRVSTEPYLASRGGVASIHYMKNTGFTIFGTSSGIFKIKPGDAAPIMVAARESRSAERLQSIGQWPH